jgi:hypothetical protein
MIQLAGCYCNSFRQCDSIPTSKVADVALPSIDFYVILAGGLAFIFTWGLLASIYFHRPWRSLQQLPRMPSRKGHTLRDHI